MTNACDPEAIAALTQGGDPAAIDRIASCFLERLRGVGRCACGDATSAEDAVQDTLVSAMTHLGSFRGEGSVEAWLSTMVVNHCRARHRGRKNDPAWNAELDEETPLAHAGADECTARAQLLDHLTRALDTLPARDRWLFLMAEQEGRTAPELGAELGLAPTAVRARLTRIRRALRLELDRVWAEWSATA